MHIFLEKISEVLQKALQADVYDQEQDNSLIFYDLDFLARRIEFFKQQFPKALIAVAVKANPLPKVLKFLKQFDVGAEAATFPELYIAEMSGYAPDKMVFDSPAKTEKELKYAFDLGIHLNIDSLEEAERITGLLETNKTNCTFGIRINPQVGSGTIAITSTAGSYSKFGIPLDEFKDEIRQLYRNNAWLTGVHLHIGSQGCPINQLVSGIKKVYDFIEETNQWLQENHCQKQINIFDIGGGFPANYHHDAEIVHLEEYRQKLEKECPELFTGKYQIITEFGRSIHANSGWVASKVEYVKEYSGKKTAVIHVGADLLMRRCYFPEDWHHEFSVLDRTGKIKETKETDKYTIVGPLCFSGDILVEDIELPKIEPEDYVIIHDTGAYTLSMWSRHLSRKIPLVLGYTGDGEKLDILKQRESDEDVFRFWQ